MAFFDRLVGDPRMREQLRQRAAGDGTMARQSFAAQRAANAGVATATAARLADRGAANPALAGRVAAQQQGQMDAAAGQVFAQQQTAERQRAEMQLADMRAQRQGFFRQMLGAGLRGAGALAGQMGIGAPTAQPGGLPATSGPSGTALAGIGGLAGTAVGGPLGGMVGGQLGTTLSGAVQPTAAAPASAPTMGLVDQAIAGGPPGAVAPPPLPGVVDTSGLTDDEYLQWLVSQRGGV